MKCETARLLLAFHRPTGPAELPPSDAAALSAHLAECPACSRLAATASAFDQKIASAMKSVPVPEGLQARLLTTTLARRGATQRRGLYRTLTGLAAVVVAGILVYSVSLRLRPSIETGDLAFHQSTDWENPEEMVRRFLVERDLPTDFPLDFDFRLALTCAEKPLIGKNTPVIVLQTWLPGRMRPDTALIYLVEPSRFNLQSLQDAQSSFANVQVFHHRGLAYIVVFSSSLKPFLKSGTPVASL